MQINYSKAIRHKSINELSEIILDYENWHLWWPSKFKVAYYPNQGKDFMYFSPFFGITIVWDLKKGHTGILNTKYIRGPVAGEGVWNVEKKNEEIVVSYNINVKPKNLFYRLFWNKKMFKRTHLGHMEELFSSLEKYAQQK